MVCGRLCPETQALSSRPCGSGSLQEARCTVTTPHQLQRPGWRPGRPAQARRTLNQRRASRMAAPGTSPPRAGGALSGAGSWRVAWPAGSWHPAAAHGGGPCGCSLVLGAGWLASWVAAQLSSPAGRSGAQLALWPRSGQTLRESSRAQGSVCTAQLLPPCSWGVSQRCCRQLSPCVLSSTRCLLRTASLVSQPVDLRSQDPGLQ